MRRAGAAAFSWLIAVVAAVTLAVGANGSAKAQALSPPVSGQTPASGAGGGHQHGGAGQGGGQHGDHKHDEQAHDEQETPHVHAPVPPEYRKAHVPSAAWTNEALIARGKDIYGTRCSVCHGEQGDGKGPAAAGLPLKPPSFLDTRMVNEMAGNYWFWRVSEGGLVEPFKSMGSVMPAWKTELSPDDRWAVIAYTHTLSGHTGPHVTSEHPEMLMAGHGTHDLAATNADAGKSKSQGSHQMHQSGATGAPMHKH